MSVVVFVNNRLRSFGDKKNEGRQLLTRCNPTTSMKMRTFWGSKDKPFTLSCLLPTPENNNFSLEWRKDDKLILSAFGAEAGHVAPALQGRIARGSYLDLTIHALSIVDIGRYHCVLTRFGRQSTKSEIGPPSRLIVSAPPIIIWPKSYQINYRNIGELFSIECKAEGVPPPEVNWTKNDEIISTGPILRIEKLEKKHEGIYICLAVNVEGRAFSQFELKFSKLPKFILFPTNQTVLEGSDVLWRCRADGYQSNALRYSWMFSDRPIKTTSTGARVDMKEDGDISITNIRKKDRGWYSCCVLGPSDEKAQVSAFLDVVYAPEALPSHKQVLIIGYGKSERLTCLVDGNPKPNIYTWAKNGHFIATSTEDTLLIRGNNESDGGIYSCQARNSVGKSAVLETHVVIAGPPIFITRPPPELRVHEGDPVNVTCRGFGDPVPIVYWTHLKKRISSSTLSFSSVSHKDFGKYDCIVSNTVLNISSSMNLIVEKSRPQAAIIERVDCAGDESMALYWKPGFNGSYPQTFVVHYSSEESPSDDRSLLTASNFATIRDLKAFTKYRIHIESRNERGSMNSSAVEKYVCSTLSAPMNVRFSGEFELRWDPVPYAQSYKVESKPDNISSFEEIGEIIDPVYRIRPEFQQNRLFRVRSLRASYEPSIASKSISLDSYEITLPSLWWAVLGGFLLIFIFVILYFSSKYGNQQARSYRRSKHVCSSLPQPQVENLFGDSVNIVDRSDDNQWNDSVKKSIMQTKSQNDFDYCFPGESTNAVDDMLKEKYVMTVQDIPVQLMNDLRIERLRREFKQFHS